MQTIPRELVDASIFSLNCLLQREKNLASILIPKLGLGHTLNMNNQHLPRKKIDFHSYSLTTSHFINLSYDRPR